MSDVKLHLTIVAGPSGARPSVALERIRIFLGDGYVASRDVEHRLVAIANAIAAGTRKDTASDLALGRYLNELSDAPWNIESICHRLPRDLVSVLWQRAADECIAELSDETAAIRVLKTHLIYYRGEFSEFFSPASEYLRAILDRRKAIVDRILVFIDDIYDMHDRLTAEGEVFAFTRELENEHLRVREYEDSARSSGYLPSSAPPSALDEPSERYRISLGLVLRNLMRLLTWRENEIVAAEDIARSMGQASYVLATKHPISVGAAILKGDHKEPENLLTYLSHPISRPRKTQRVTGKWPPFVDEYHSFINTLLETTKPIRVLPVMPTAIDEYRIKTVPIVFRTRSHESYIEEVYLPVLTNRWPLLAARQQLMCDLPEDFDVEQTKIFDPPLDPEDTTQRFVNGNKEFWRDIPITTLRDISGMLRSFILTLTQQMSRRDHLLVRQCAGFLLYRPLHQEKGFSRGVLAEIDNWQGLVSLQTSIPKETVRPILFIHHASDLEAVEDEQVDVIDDVIEVIREEAHVNIARERLRKLDLRSEGWVDALALDESVISRGKLSATDRNRLKTAEKRINERVAAVLLEARKTIATRDAVTTPGAVCGYYEIDTPPTGKAAKKVRAFWRQAVDGALTQWSERIAEHVAPGTPTV